MIEVREGGDTTLRRAKARQYNDLFITEGRTRLPAVLPVLSLCENPLSFACCHECCARVFQVFVLGQVRAHVRKQENGTRPML